MKCKIFAGSKSAVATEINEFFKQLSKEEYDIKIESATQSYDQATGILLITLIIS